MITDNAYISFVNLDHRKDRLEHMQVELARVGLQAQRTRGRLPHEFWYRNDVDKMKVRTPGAIGCYFSQISIMEEAMKQGQHAIVLEDDLVFCSDFQKRLEYISNWLDGKEWDVFWLGGTFHSPAYWHPIGPSGFANVSANLGYDVKPTEDQRIVRTYGAFSTHAYIVNKDSIDKVLKKLNEFLPNSIGIDHNFIYWQARGITSYAFVPGCVKQLDNISDIGKGMTNFSGFAQLNGNFENSRYWFQDKMEDFDAENFKWI